MRSLDDIKRDNLRSAYGKAIERAREGKTAKEVASLLKEGGLEPRICGNSENADVEVWVEKTYLVTLHGTLESALEDLVG